MAANFWTSNHHSFLITEEEANDASSKLFEAGLSGQQVKELKTFFCQQIFEIVATLKGSRLRVATTACVYFHRFYVRKTFVDHDPRLVTLACIYIAGKAEENSQHSKTVMINVLRHKHELVGPIDTKLLLDFEMIVVQELGFNLLVFSPHHSLREYLLDFRQHPSACKRAFEELLNERKEPLISQVSWGLVCDACCCGACVLEPPFTIALAALILAAQMLKIDYSTWLKDIEYDVDGVYRVIRLLLQMRHQMQLDASEAVRLVKLLLVWHENQNTATATRAANA